MSWSLSACGRPEPVAMKLAEGFRAITYLSPEEAAVKDAIANVVGTALESQKTPVDVQASGSLSGGTHFVTLTIKPLNNLV